MPTTVLELIFRSIKQGTGAADAEKEAKQLTKTIGDGLKTAAAGAAIGIGALAGAYAATVGPAADYARQVRDLGRDIGQNARETSLLIQVADDLQVSYDTLRVAAREMNKDGIQPTFANLKDLARQYQALGDPVKQAQFSLDHFGKSGSEMRKILETDVNQLEELKNGAISAGLVMNDKGTAAALAYEQSLDALQDQIKGVQIALGSALIPVLTGAAQGMQNVLLVTQALAIKFQEATGQISHNEAVMRATALAGGDLQAVAESLGGSYGALDESTRATTRSQDLLNASQQAGKTDAVEPLIGADDALAMATQRLTNSLIYQKASQDLSAEAALSLGRSLGVVDDKSVIAATKINEYRAQLDAGQITQTEYINKVHELAAALGAIPDKTITVTTRFVEDRGGGTATTVGNGVMRAVGGSYNAGALLTGELGPELQFPGSAGFVMNNSDSRRLIAALEALVTGMGRPNQNVTINQGAADTSSSALLRALAGAF